VPRKIKVAAVQMDANPAPVSERLNRAEKLITQAAQEGAQLVVLPELFNIGYTYTDSNFDHAEPLEGGTTTTWMKENASRLHIHLAGTLLILEDGEIYNSLLLFSPSGQRWRYDKNYPWAWERGYFRGRSGTAIAHTELGDFGMLICWDVAHTNLWKQYAGKIDMVLASSCPPDGPQASYHFRGGYQINFNDLGSVMGSIKDSGELVFDKTVRQQARWLGVPVVNSGGAGKIHTPIPKAKSLMASFVLMAPRLIKQLPNADQMQMGSDMIASCKVVGADGQIITSRHPNESDGYAIAEVTLQDKKPQPSQQQPKSPVHPMAFLNADVMVPWIMKSVYNNGKKRIASKRKI